MEHRMPRLPIELRDLEYFALIVRHGRIGAAAVASGIAQPTLSNAMARLEQAVGTALWDKTGPRRAPLRLTPVGEALRQRAERALTEVAALETDLDALAGFQRGHLRVGCMPSLMAGVLPAAIAEYHMRYPGIEITVSTVRSDTCEAAMRQQDVDGVIVSLSPDQRLAWPSLHCGTQRFQVVMRKDHPLAQSPHVCMADLAQEPLVLVPEHTFTFSLIRQSCEAAGYVPQPTITLDSPEGLRELVRRGMGLSILPTGYVAQTDHDLVCRPILNPAPSRPIVLLHRGLESQRHLQAFAQIFPQHISALEGILNRQPSN